MNKILKPVAIGVGINLLLPKIVRPYATEEEIKPPSGNAKDLPFKSQLVHMMVHHNQVPISSSVIIAAIITLSILLSEKI